MKDYKEILNKETLMIRIQKKKSICLLGPGKNLVHSITPDNGSEFALN